ncbi:MAG: hypothetical protein ABJA87_05245 [bacterium]
MSLDRPPQRRDNGLPGDRFVALADVDPRLGDHLLDLLRLAEIPAYLEPPADLRAGRQRDTGPLERLWVHERRRQDARAVVVAAAHEAGASPAAAPPSATGGASRGPDLLAGIDADAEFARLTAAFDADTAVEPTVPGAAAAPSGPALDAAADARVRDLATNADTEGEVEEHFEPPPPPPFPVPTAATVGAFAVFFLGLLVLARGDWLGLTPDITFPLGIITVLVGAGLLIARLHDRHPVEEDGDDGAVL